MFVCLLTTRIWTNEGFQNFHHYILRDRCHANSNVRGVTILRTIYFSQSSIFLIFLFQFDYCFVEIYIDLSIEQIDGTLIDQFLSSWIITNDFLDTLYFQLLSVICISDIILLSVITMYFLKNLNKKFNREKKN